MFGHSGTNDAPADVADLVNHLDAAYSLARCLLRNPSDAEDAVQEACLRAVHYYHGLRGSNSRHWMLAIVRNACYDWMSRGRASGHHAPSDDHLEGLKADAPSPEAVLLEKEDAAAVRQALEALPAHLREVIVLREFEDLHYKEIAALAGIPIGTVMSRLSRARKHLESLLSERRSAAIRTQLTYVAVEP